jgi:hypothetical protein
MIGSSMPSRSQSAVFIRSTPRLTASGMKPLAAAFGRVNAAHFRTWHEATVRIVRASFRCWGYAAVPR